ncbi:MAG TPA: hypothetical protein VH255_06750 [Verrucomicrobiae bacterium]|nr:hypothetical protein [Verrucomicrobiae bacterium]
MKKLSTFAALVALLSLTGCIVAQPQPQQAYYAPQPVVVQPQPVYAPAPVVVEAPQVEVVTEVEVTPIVVNEYYFVGGHYYYWHPGYNRYVVLRGEPPSGHRILHEDHLAPRDRQGNPHPEYRGPDGRPPEPVHHPVVNTPAHRPPGPANDPRLKKKTEEEQQQQH